MARSTAGVAAISALACLMMAGCSDGTGTGTATASSADPFPGGPPQQADRGSVFGDGGLSVGTLMSGEAFGGGETRAPGDALPVNRFLWQASLDTLGFLPLASTDPFTGVITTDWGMAPQSPGERFKVTAYMVSPALEASSLKVAVYRQIRTPDGAWVPAAVNPDTARRLEDAILTRARQIRIAELDGTATG